MGTAFGDRAFYRGDWTFRAATAVACIYGNNATEDLYPRVPCQGADHCRRKWAFTKLAPARAIFARGQHRAE